MSFFNYPDHALPTGNEVLVDFSSRITDEMTAKKLTSEQGPNVLSDLSDSAREISENYGISLKIVKIIILFSTKIAGSITKTKMTMGWVIFILFGICCPNTVNF